MKYHYHGAGPFPEEEDYMDAKLQVIDIDLKKAVSAEDYNEITTKRRGWYGVSIDIEYQEWTGHTIETTFTGAVVADSMLDAYNKAKEYGIKEELPPRSELTRVARIDKCDIDFLGMQCDDGFSVKAWEEFVENEQKNAARRNMGERIKELREAHNMSQQQLSAAAGITLPNVRNIEAGKYNVNIDVLAKIATALGEELVITAEPNEE